jgi:flagellar basal body-associated protein FliL
MSSKLDQLSEFMTTKKEETEEPSQKRTRVTKEVEPQSKESWVTAITRATAVAALSAGGWYMQHVYGKPSAPVKKKEEQKTAPPLLQSNPANRLNVGKSGFVV